MDGRLLVVHIGPHKTGTSSLQSLLHDNRDRLIQNSVQYVGTRVNHHIGALAFLRRKGLDGSIPALRHWDQTVKEIHASKANICVISSEHFSYAEPSQIVRLADQFRSFRLRVLISARPLDAVLPSLWSHLAQVRELPDKREWLEQVLARRDDSDSIWKSQQYDLLIERWRSVDETQAPTVIVPTKHHINFSRLVEEACSFPLGTLRPASQIVNQRLSDGETEFSRHFESAIRSSGYPHGLYLERRRISPGRVLRRAESLRQINMDDLIGADLESQLRAVNAEVVSQLKTMTIRWVGNPQLLISPRVERQDQRTQAPTSIATLSMEQAAYVSARLVQDVVQLRRVASNRRIRNLQDYMPEMRSKVLLSILVLRAIRNIRKPFLRGSMERVLQAAKRWFGRSRS